MMKWRTRCTPDITGRLSIKLDSDAGLSLPFSRVVVLIRESSGLSHLEVLLTLCGRPDSLRWGRAGTGTDSELGSPVSFLARQRKAFQVVVAFGRNVVVLKIPLSVEDDWFCFNFPILNIHFVATQHDGDVFPHVPELCAS